MKHSQGRIIIAKFVRRQTKIGQIPNKSNLRKCEIDGKTVINEREKQEVKFPERTSASVTECPLEM